MTTAYTSLLGLALPVTGELSGTWGDTVNNSITSLVDTAVAGTTNVSADSNVTLTTTTGASNQARQAILLFSGARTAIRTVTAPAQSKIYTVINATTGGFAVTLVGAGPTTGVTIANGARTVVAWNGSDFVEVSSPSSIILPGGTANGVLYLNGSKVVTSGSALVFDGTNLSLGGSITAGRAHFTSSGTPASGAGVEITYGQEAANTGGILAYNRTASTYQNIIYNAAAHIYNISGSEQMRLTSTGLGIGTSTAYSKLYLKQPGNGSGVAGFVIENSANDNRLAQYFDGSGDEWRITASYGTTGAFKPITFWTSDTKRLTLDSSGNLGLGVTPSALDIGRTIQVGFNSNTIWGATANNFQFLAGATYNNAYLYAVTGAAVSNYRQNAGQHQWYNAPSGTAGNNVTFTQAMTLDASGNLGVGTSSPDSISRLTLDRPSFNQFIMRVSGTEELKLYADAAVSSIECASNPLLFLTGGSERARIDSSGNLLVGATSGPGKLTVEGNGASNYAASFTNTVTNNNVLLVAGDASSNSQNYVVFAKAGTVTGSITYNGTVVAYNATSDYRLKEISGNLTGYKERVMSLRPKQGTWISNGSEFRGFLAHEFQNFYSSSVTGKKDAVDENGIPVMQAMQAGSAEVIADLVALLQEQQAIIESLKARLDAANL